MKWNKNIFVVLFFLACTSFSGHSFIDQNKSLEARNAKKIVLIPLGKVSTAFIKESYDELKKFVPMVELRHSESMPSSCYYKPRARYRADKLINWLNGRAGQNETWAGITMNDISTTKGNIYDYGVMGLGNCPGNACVASNYRLKNKKNFYKVIIHELGHTTGLPHCVEKTCYMTAADGGDPTAKEDHFCDKCKRHLIRVGWKLK